MNKVKISLILLVAALLGLAGCSNYSIGACYINGEPKAGVLTKIEDIMGDQYFYSAELFAGEGKNRMSKNTGKIGPVSKDKFSQLIAGSKKTSCE